MSSEEFLRIALDAMVQANGGSKIAIITARDSDPRYADKMREYMREYRTKAKR